MPIHKQYTKELTLYTLEEMLADPQLKTNLLKANQESEQFLDISLQQDVEDIESELESKGFYDVKVYYDLSCSQGSGAYFTFDGVNVLKLMKKEKSIYYSAYIIKYAFKDWGRKLRQLDSYVGIRTIQNHWANHNCHSRCVDIEFNYSNIDFTEKEYSKSFKNFEADFNDLYQDFCSNIYSKLQKSLEYFTSDEFLIEDLKAREEFTLFHENGTICQEYDLTNVNDSSLLNNITGFMYSNNSYVIIDKDGKIFSYKDDIKRNPLDGDFLDTSDESDQGLSKAVIFMNINEANEFIVDTLVDNYETVTVEQAFKKEK